MDLSRNAMDDVMYHYSRNMRDYMDNVHEYNNNINTYLHMIEQRNTRPAASPFINNFIRNYVQSRDEGNVFRNTFEDVIVRPTNQQIAVATERIRFTETSVYNNTSCPITLEPFEDGEQVCRIIHCAHLFKPAAISDWFQRNVRCPVCRYDIRNFNPEEEEQYDEMVRELVREIPAQPRRNDFMRTFINEIRNSPFTRNTTEFVYTFDIPLYDNSMNAVD